MIFEESPRVQWKKYKEKWKNQNARLFLFYVLFQFIISFFAPKIICKRNANKSWVKFPRMYLFFFVLFFL